MAASGLANLTVIRLAEAPDDLEDTLRSLYRTPFSTLLYFRLFRELTEWDTFLVHSEGALIHALVVTRSKRTATVQNSLVQFEAAEMDAIAAAVFREFSEVRRVKFLHIRMPTGQPETPAVIRRVAEDIVLELPASGASMNAKLGARTRKHLRYYERRLSRDYPNDWFFSVLSGDQVNDEVVHEIAEMNRARMRAKGRVPGVDEPYERRIRDLASYQGLVGKLVVGGEFVAGALCLKVANEYYLYVVAHDPSYDRYDVGFLGLYKTIIECIGLGGAVFHFLWGESEYKYRLLGVKVDLYEATLHRTSLDQRYWGLRSRARSPLSHEARAMIKSEIRRWRWIAVPLKWIVGLAGSQRHPESRPRP